MLAPKIAFITLGCVKNEVDSDKMQALLAKAGYSIIDDASVADLIIVNTCAFLESAVEEGLELIFDLARQETGSGSSQKILVAGCMPARYGEDLSTELTEASAFLRIEDENKIVEAVEDLIGPAPSRSLTEEKTRYACGPSAYVKISDGCDRFCSYCMIPYIRGRYHSYPLAQIISEVDELVSSGTKEIVLIGQDTGIWGQDFEEPDTCAHLLEVLATRFPSTWFRILYTQPEGISDELLGIMGSYENICSYLDIPLQHAEPVILKNMNRSGSVKEYLELISHIRSSVPGIMLRTTFMAGFPGETEEQFQCLVDFAEEACFDYAGVFAYSPEEGSAAFDFVDQIDEDIRLERAQILLDTCELIGTHQIADLVGKRAEVLVEGYEMSDVGLEALCRTQGQAPEVDGQVHVPIKDKDELSIGDFAYVELVDSFYYELEGRLIDSGK